MCVPSVTSCMSTGERRKAMRVIWSSFGRMLRVASHWNILSSGLISLVSLVLFLGVWEFVVDIRWINRILVPPPSAIVKEVWRNLASIFTGGSVFQHFYVTVVQILIGFGISVVLGLLIAVFVSEVPLLRRAIYPYIIAFNSLPRVAFAPLFVIWFGFANLVAHCHGHCYRHVSRYHKHYCGA